MALFQPLTLLSTNLIAVQTVPSLTPKTTPAVKEVKQARMMEQKTRVLAAALENGS
jgi:hypothetical protein